MTDWGSDTTSLGSTTLKDKQVVFGIKDQDRLRHMCVLGKDGSGRGEFISRMAFQDIERGLGTVILDAKGNVAPYFLERCDQSIVDRVIYLDPSEAEYPYTWNILGDIRKLPKSLQETYLVRLIKSIYKLESVEVVKHLAPLILEKEDTTLITLYSVVAEESVRKDFFNNDEDALITFGNVLDQNEKETKDIVENGRYLAKDVLIRNLLGQSESKFSLSDLSDGKIVIVNFENIRMYPTRMVPLVRTFVEAALMAGETSERPSIVYLQDALRHLGDDEIERAFSSARTVFTVADTVIQEEDRERREQALSRCGSVASFKIHRLDKPLVERAFYPYVEPEELERLEERELVVALTIDAVRTRPFFATALPIERHRASSYQDLVIISRNKYTTARTEVDEQFKSEDDDIKRPKKPAGFQDAFKAMFDKRAAAANGQNKAKDKKENGDSKQESTKKEKGGEKPKETSEVKERRPSEVPEDALKNMLYVPAV